MNNKTSPEHWRNINPGDSVVLTDEQAIQESLRRDQGADGLTYLVQSVIKISELNGLCEWRLLKLDDEEQDVRLLIKIVDDEVDLRVVFGADGFESGNRQDMIDAEELWLFNEPEDPDNFDLIELQFANEVLWNVPVGGPTGDGMVEATYRKKVRDFYGRVFTDPPESGVGDQIATIVEYVTDADCDNPELLILETGEVGSILIEEDYDEDGEFISEEHETTTNAESQGGYIEVFFGALIRANEVSVLTINP